MRRLKKKEVLGNLSGWVRLQEGEFISYVHEVVHAFCLGIEKEALRKGQCVYESVGDELDLFSDEGKFVQEMRAVAVHLRLRRRVWVGRDDRLFRDVADGLEVSVENLLKQVDQYTRTKKGRRRTKQITRRVHEFLATKKT